MLPCLLSLPPHQLRERKMKGYRARPQTSPLTASSGQDRGAHDGDPGLCDLRETVHLFRSMKCDRCNTSLDFIPRLGQFHNSLPLQSYTQNPPPIPLYKERRDKSKAVLRMFLVTIQPLDKRIRRIPVYPGISSNGFPWSCPYARRAQDPLRSLPDEGP